MIRYIYMSYENEAGKLVFDRNNLRILALEGLGAPTKIYCSSQYIGYDGSFTLSEKRTSRTINVKFDIGSMNQQYELRRIMRILDSGGVLIIQCGDTVRKTTVQQVVVNEPEDKRAFRVMTVQFVCDEPYFHDRYDTVKMCYEVLKGIEYDGETDTWNLGEAAVWGSLKNDKVIINSGDYKVFPLFTIRVTGTAENGGGFEILKVNEKYTAEDADERNVIQKLQFDYATTDSEVITVNTDGRREGGRFAYSSLKGPVTKYRSDGTSLSKFWLDTGRNRIVVNNKNSGSKFEVSITYNNNYAEAVY